MTLRSQALGRSGERRAARFLEGLGWRLLDRGWRSRYGEIDIVGLDGTTLVFVEVKTRSSARFGTPEAAVGQAKRARLVRSALHYIEAKGDGGRPLRFDVVALEGDELRHIPDAFQAEGYTR
ncbi:MAG: YraN family protein [Elusimicrobiota bacterium]